MNNDKENAMYNELNNNKELQRRLALLKTEYERVERRYHAMREKYIKLRNEHTRLMLQGK